MSTISRLGGVVDHVDHCVVRAGLAHRAFARRLDGQAPHRAFTSNSMCVSVVSPNVQNARRWITTSLGLMIPLCTCVMISFAESSFAPVRPVCTHLCRCVRVDRQRNGRVGHVQHLLLAQVAPRWRSFNPIQSLALPDRRRSGLLLRLPWAFR